MAKYIKFFDTNEKEITCSKEIKGTKELFHVAFGTNTECAIVMSRAQAEILQNALYDLLDVS